MSLFGSRFRFGARVPGRFWLQVMWWDIVSLLCVLPLVLLYRFFVRGAENIPREGGVLFIANHQSYFDPMVNGSSCASRQFTAIASIHLFGFKPFGWMMHSLGAIKVSASAGDAGAMRAALAELKAGRCVLIYPEGGRSFDGFVAPFKRGTALLLRRAKNVQVVPIGIAGAFDVWPRARLLPKPRGRIAAVVGKPMLAADLLKMGTDSALEHLHGEVDRLRLEGRAVIRERSRGRWPVAGLTDEPSPS